MNKFFLEYEPIIKSQTTRHTACTEITVYLAVVLEVV